VFSHRFAFICTLSPLREAGTTRTAPGNCGALLPCGARDTARPGRAHRAGRVLEGDRSAVRSGRGGAAAAAHDCEEPTLVA